MCGRYVLASLLAEIEAAFAAGVSRAHDEAWAWQANYNLAPASVAPVIALDGQGMRKIVPMRWGLHPHWKRDMPEGKPLFNARSETAFEKPSFRTPWRRRRALVPATAWYEWQGADSPKTPFFIRDASQPLMAFAGLWDMWRASEGVNLLSFSILTTPASDKVKHIHHRMPVRLPQASWQNWLDPAGRPEQAMGQMLGGENLTFHEVSRAVNSGRAQGEDLILPINSGSVI